MDTACSSKPDRPAGMSTRPHPLHAGELPSFITPAAAEELIPGATPLRIILGTVASTPGVSRILLSASTPKYWSEAAQAALDKPLDSTQLRRITRAFST
jgi:hypothetical protein